MWMRRFSGVEESSEGDWARLAGSWRSLAQQIGAAAAPRGARPPAGRLLLLRNSCNRRHIIDGIFID